MSDWLLMMMFGRANVDGVDVVPMFGFKAASAFLIVFSVTATIVPASLLTRCSPAFSCVKLSQQIEVSPSPPWQNISG